jgi:LmbE family N-acetylglucosaminyl deacetylase
VTVATTAADRGGDDAGVVLHLSPHPDDETLGAGPALGVLAAAGRRVVNVACGLGRAADHERRGKELAAALAEWGFDDERLDPPVPLGSSDDLAAARTRVGHEVLAVLRRLGPAIVVSPHPADGHHGHETVAAGVGDALQQWAQEDRAAPVWWQWGFWRDLPRPTVFVPFGAAVLGKLDRALDAYAGEVARNDFSRLPVARGTVGAVVGWERVFGFGSRSQAPMPYADVVTEWVWHDGAWWWGTPRVLDPAAPLAAPTDERATS